MGTRTSAERDAATVEIVFALLSAVLLAAAVGGAAVAATVVLHLPAGALTVGAGLAASVFAARIVQLLTAWRRRGRTHSGGGDGRGLVQPSHPGRTSPVS
ncbi:DUF6332 family protein [Streptomyces sp. NBC_01497]|uniref:DUF6332 family protein n=1 Tax=Streptomyces sp. NBC_01497 TaxID=2903885 RepID=UPI002E30D4AE|nr:DUF6332 family protein [Streptomyces sp. NBC_01497]